MAMQIAAGTPPTAVPTTSDRNTVFHESFGKVSSDFASKGTSKITISKIGDENLVEWTRWIEEVLGMPCEFTINYAGDEIAIAPMKERETATGNSKVRRPLNAWILYRKDWHETVVKENPNVHNNDISKIIARKWAEETSAVKDEYKRKAEDAKRQHAIDHPGYQYQPRKPSEKKKRMTKTKLAKMKAKENAGLASNTIESHGALSVPSTGYAHATVKVAEGPAPNLHPIQNSNDMLAFSSTDDDVLLLNQLIAWNTANPQPNGADINVPSVLSGLPVADDTGPPFPPQFEVDFDYTPINDVITDSTSTALYSDPFAEVERQDRIADDALNALFNFDSFP